MRMRRGLHDQNGYEYNKKRKRKGETNLEALVLENFLDGDVITISRTADEPCLKDDAEGAIAYDFAVCVGDFFLVACSAIGGDYSNDLVRVVDS